MKTKSLIPNVVRYILIIAIGVLLVPNLSQGNLIVHEWGTFTSLQDENGEAIGGINTDDEPVPSFVHRIGFVVNQATDRPGNWMQGAPRAHPSVTMRLETPVIYFYHREPGELKPFNVEAAFNGGWLTEYFPDAEVSGPGFPDELNNGTVGTLKWDNVILTNDSPTWKADGKPVWTTPRKVDALTVETREEKEKYLFYRGVGHLNAPIKVIRNSQEDKLELHPNFDSNEPLTVDNLWLVNIRSDGKAAFQELGRHEICAGESEAFAEADATLNDFSLANMELLISAMKQALIEEGMFEKEALAMLNTWEISYFKSTGLRLFFIVPREWVDENLPLKIDATHTLERAMIGRIEIVTPEQREKLATIAEGPVPDMEPLRTAFYENVAEKNELVTAPLAEMASTLNMEIPFVYQAYIDLGRFRHALLMNEFQQRPTKPLEQFISRQFDIWNAEGFSPAKAIGIHRSNSLLIPALALATILIVFVVGLRFSYSIFSSHKGT